MKTVVFDLGGVLIDWNPRYLFRSLFNGDDNEMEYFLKHICNQEWNEKQDEGRSFIEAQNLLIAQYPRFENQISIYFDRWDETLGGPISGTVEILEALARSKKYQLLALSNWSAETFTHALKKFEFLKLFETILVSGHEKLIKPDPRFFNLLVERHGVTPSNALFIDDVERNIRAAEALGFHFAFTLRIPNS